MRGSFPFYLCAGHKGAGELARSARRQAVCLDCHYYNFKGLGRKPMTAILRQNAPSKASNQPED
jgi:hypothetical protein